VVIRQGDVFWVHLPAPQGSEPGYRHPHVVVQNDAFNESQIATVVTCIITSNLRRAAQPGNVALAAGEANLPKPSVVNISQLATLDRDDLGGKLGSLSKRRVRQIVQGIALLLQPM
jgi:mRNA interferase MazF